MSAYKKIVVKVGSALLTADGATLDVDYIRRIAAQIAAVHADGCEVALVSSGAVAAGMKRLGLGARPQQRGQIQLCAAVGQMGLMNAYDDAFARHRLRAAQVLLTAEDMAHRTLYLNARMTLRRMLTHAIIPVINENDVIATDWASFGDNDRLAAQITNLIEADLLIMLTAAPGLCRDAADAATLIRRAQAGDKTLRAYVGGAVSKTGSGGMASKLDAAAVAARSGADTVIADGRAADVIGAARARPPQIGTWLRADKPRLSARKQWLASALNVRGRAILDAGAARAVAADHRSLLSAGVRRVEGDFIRGDCISLFDENATLIAHALVNYDSAAAAKLCGVKSADIKAILGYVYEDELAHRDNISVAV